LGLNQETTDKKINSKVRSLALKRALFESGKDGEIRVIEQFSAEEIKTKAFKSVLDKIATGKTLLVDDSFDEKVVLSSRNISGVELQSSAALNALDVVHKPNIIISEKGLGTLIARIKGGNE